MELLFAATTPKDVEFPEENEDAFAVDVTGGRIVVCDGASESFDAKGWATALRDAFMESPNVSAPWLEEVQGRAATRHDVETLSWSRHAAWERGSFATLLGVRWNADDRELVLWCVGDSLFILRRNGDSVVSIPYTQSVQFSEHPQLLSTVQHHNDFVCAEHFAEHHVHRWQFETGDEVTILCMTDALGAWLLAPDVETSNERMDRLLGLHDEIELTTLVVEERAAGRMRRDDSTLVVVQLLRG